MKVIRFDAGFRYDDPNARWGDPSFVLEPGDPGYVGPDPPPQPSNPKPHKSMSNNEIPENLKVLLAMAEDAADGCASHEVAIGLKSVMEADLRPAIVALKGTLTPPPPVPGLIGIYDQAKQDTAAAKAGLKAKDAEAKRFLTDTRDVLKKVLGTKWSPEWVLAGYTAPGSTAVPGRQDDRFASLAALAVYLAAHPTYEVPAGGPYPEVTAARATLLHTEISDCRALVNAREADQGTAGENRDAGTSGLRALMIALVDELTLRLGPADPLWEALGLNIPANPRPPEPASNLLLSPAGSGRVLAEWTRGRRSDNNRVLVWIVGVDADWREHGKSGNVTEFTLKDQPPGATLKVKILALNGSLEAPDGPEAEIVVPG
ncbi:MAG: fibronectin type III domain-containing protein [Verrucomicrobiae bacterium]|nr:fibronectin type III domain-containing protein [Verrucomicrobiae bacterium]